MKPVRARGAQRLERRPAGPADRASEGFYQVFLSLGARLSAAKTPLEATRAVYEAADQLWKWDAAALDLYSPESNTINTVLDCDVIEGRRREVAYDLPPRSPSPRMLRVMRQGAELIPRLSRELPDTDSAGFGSVPHPTEAKMYVPIRREGQAIGVLTIQSYTPEAYAAEDLLMLQALADYCAGALERIRTSAALQQREELNRSIVATAMDGFCVLDFGKDPAGAIVEVNHAYCRLSGYSRGELLQMRVSDLEARESPEEIAHRQARILTTGSDRFETVHRRKDGQEIAVEVSLCRLGDSRHRMFGFVRDITQRKRSEVVKEAFLSLGAKLSTARTPPVAARAIFASADLLWKWDCGVLDLQVPASELVETAVAYDVLEGQRREINLHPPIGPPSPRYRRVLAQGAELILLRPDEPHPDDSMRVGDTSRASLSLMNVPVRQESRTVGVLSVQSYQPHAFTREDLEMLQALADYGGGALERLASGVALHESEERYRSLINNLNVGVYRTTPGPRGRFLEANPALARMYGYESVGQFQQTCVSEHYQNPGERQLFIHQVMNRGTVVNAEVRLRRTDGTPFWGSTSATAHYGADGQVDWIDGILEDITERKQAEVLLQVQRDLGVKLSLATSLEAAFDSLLEVSLEIRGIDCGGVYLLQDPSGAMRLVAHRGVSPAFVRHVAHLASGDPRTQSVRQGQPLFGRRNPRRLPPEDPFHLEGLCASAFLPLSHEHQLLGALVMGSHVNEEIPARSRVVLEAVAAQAAGAIARIRAEGERHRLERQILEISDREQARIGQDIHDGLCQQLVSLAFDANSLRAQLAHTTSPESLVAQRIANLLDQAITESRQLSRGLFPIRLEQEGLVPALEELARTTRQRSQIRCRFSHKPPVAIENSTVATHLYRIAQEAINNAIKHSRASSIGISLRARGGQLELNVEDNGAGFIPKAAGKSKGMGLHIMNYRARSIGGTLSVGPRARGGTRVSCRVPAPG